MGRFLFVVPPLTGHVNPTLGVARALSARGHEVAWVGHPSKVRPLLPREARLFELSEELPQDMVERTRAEANRVRGLESLRFLWEEFLLPLARGMRPAVERVAQEYAPDVCVVDQQAIGGALAVRRLRLPWATLSTTSASVVEPLSFLPKVLQWRDAQLRALEREAGLAELHEPDRSPLAVIVFSTRLLVGPEWDFPPHYHFVGPSVSERPDAVPFPWEALRDGPRVLVTLGTVNAERGGRFYRVVAEALSGEPLQAILAAPESLAGPLPANFLRRDYVPQLELLPHMRAVVCHAGHNTVCEALSAGIPLVVAPIKDDQPVVASQVEAAGAGVRVKFGRVGPDALRAAVRRVLDDPSFREAARRIADSFSCAGGAPRAAEICEGLLHSRDRG